MHEVPTSSMSRPLRAAAAASEVSLPDRASSVSISPTPFLDSVFVNLLRRKKM